MADDLTAELDRIAERNKLVNSSDVPRLLEAVRAVLELHAEGIARTKPELPDIHGCVECAELWPCPTYLAITRKITGKGKGSA